MDEELRIDNSGIDHLQLREAGTSIAEVKEMIGQKNACAKNRSEPEPHVYVIGYLDGNKFIHIAYRVSKNINFDIHLLQVGIPDAEEIKRYWCK